ncbi:hypothetical protein [Rhodopseudomonas palustris]|uniref:hypothetical protein n=1 Tax=Rhodopseudomonas palustris TaxID=1076 RepID=UPI000D1B9EFE|nr:hypothetical protein [Rhodopseudomonas palustris]AVT83644.1 hypothetical protein RPYSC3_47840 [Rhodopseudomonas palustris]
MKKPKFTEAMRTKRKHVTLREAMGKYKSFADAARAVGLKTNFDNAKKSFYYGFKDALQDGTIILNPKKKHDYLDN